MINDFVKISLIQTSHPLGSHEADEAEQVRERLARFHLTRTMGM